MPDLFDIIELIRDLPGHGLRSGMQGTIVDKHADNAYEVEFIDEHGETIDFLSLYSDQFIVVWKAETKTWVSLPEKVAALVAELPEEDGSKVFDFARFLSSHREESLNGNKI